MDNRRKEDPVIYCKYCGKKLERRRFPSGRLEDLSAFSRRKYCDRMCMRKDYLKTETGNLDPITDYAKFCDKVNAHVIDLIHELNPKYFFIENPRGGLCNMTFMQGIPKYLVTYCQYGDTRMKPTHIFTNYPNPQFKHCKNGDPCHEKAPRGSRTGTQGIKGSVDRSRIPDKLCEYIVELCEKG